MNYVKRDIGAPKSLALSSLKDSQRQSPNWAISYRAVAPLAMLCDALLIVSMSILSGVAYHLETTGSLGDLEQFGGFAAVVAALFIALGKSRDLYNLSELLNLKSQIWRVAVKWVAVFLFLTAVAFTMKVGESFSRGATLSFAVTGLAALIGARVVWRIFLADGLAVRRFSGRKVILIAEQSSTVDSDLIETLTRHGLQPSHHFVLPADRKDTKRRKDVIAQAISSARGSNIEEIVVGANLDHWSELDSLLSELRVLPLPVNLVPVGPMSELFKLSSRTIGDTVTIEFQHGPRTLFERSIKRAFDLIVAVTGLLLLLPLFLATAVAIKLDSSGPIIFRQRRRGFNGRQFHILKFRTMLVMEDGETVVAARLKDTRVTRVGKWLRRTSIDELPQLFNVLQGSMSIVGPRPHAVAHDNEFDKLIGNYAYRHHVNPGLTGWAQVNGYRGTLRSVTDIEQRVKFDLWYIDNWNLAVDFKIILMTAIEVMRGENAY
jgi:putative colanic acid biosynthesis UDP-glucose lipid carrier transferase